MRIRKAMFAALLMHRVNLESIIIRMMESSNAAKAL